MTDNVQDGFGPVLQRIQERLTSLEARLTEGFETMSRRFDRIEKEVGSTRTVARQAWGVAQDVELTTQQRTEALERELDVLKARVDALEHSDA